MLTEVEKEKIRAEEIFREEARNALTQPKTSRQKILSFLNSNFGLFLLSAVLLSGLSGAYTWHTTRQSEAERTRELVTRLDIEISYRLSTLPHVDTDRFTFSDFHTARGALEGIAEQHPEYGKFGDFSPIFLEFEGRSLFALMWQLRALVPESESREINARLGQVKEIRTFFDFQRLERLKPPDETDSEWKMNSDDRSRYQDLLRVLSHERWRQ